MTTQWSRQGRIFEGAALPEWLAPVAEVAAAVQADDLTRFVPPHGQGRHSAVLMLFGPDRDLLLIQRASTMRAHAGQPALPGGAVDDDESAVHAALREANEETGLDPAGVDVFAQLPDLWVPVTDFVVTPVLGWWREPSPVWARDPAEVSSVHRISIEEFVDPAHRCRVVHPLGLRRSRFPGARPARVGFHRRAHLRTPGSRRLGRALGRLASRPAR
jgi:8-oxo-dGTP pyrophosphatase MutT (NUDIX family)